MNNSAFVDQIPLDATIRMDIIPKELQLPLVVVIGLIGFLIVIGLSRISSIKEEDKTVQFSSTPSKNNAASTPTKPGTPLESKTGSVMTPGGRRSARIARARKED